MNDTLLNNLAKQFESHRVVFWYDPSSEFSDQLDVMPEDVTLIRASEYNDFAIKYRLLTEEPERKFLVYYEKDEPEYEDNWLLDIQLSNTVFRTDKESILLSDLDLPHSFIGTLRKHLPFFSNKRLVKKLGTLVSNDMSEDAFEHLLLAITVGEDSFNLQMVIDSLVADYADDGEIYETVKEYGLDQLLWDDIASLYGYGKENPSIEDFYLSVFETSLQHFLGAETTLQADAYGLLKHWKDSGKFRDSGLYKTLSEKATEELSAPKHLADIPTEALSTFDDYAFVEEEIIARLTSSTLNQTMGLEAIRQIAERRRSSFWYSEYSSAYQSIVLAKTMLDAVKNISFTIDNPDAGISKYVKEWSHIDNAYRNFKTQVRDCLNINSDMEALSDKVESSYVTNFLIPLGEKWTPFAKEMLENGWRTDGGIQRQRIFYHYNIKNLQIRGNKAVVLISDAWKEMGWSAIIFIAALMGIDVSLFEAAMVEGANSWQRVRYITLPAILPVIVTVLILKLGTILDAGFNQIFMLYSPQVYSVGDIIDTWVYRQGLLEFKFGLATAVGLFKGVFGMILVLFANWISKKVTDSALF